MATILKGPSADARGIVILTTQERDRIVNTDPEVRRTLAARKGDWLVGLHHNWHDHEFEYDDLFDFSMAGEGDLIETSGREVPLVTVDACNFVPDAFARLSGDRFWDVLYIARPVFFKGMPEFLQCVRALYDRGARLRVLCICPMPPYVAADKDTVIYDLLDRYLALFSEEERRLFNLWTIPYDYPFPLDLDTVAHFYRSSKAFVHFAKDERRCRVAAYAWTQGIPVVAMKSVGSLLPQEFQRPPYFFEAKGYEDFPGRVLEALASPEADFSPVRSHFVETETTHELKRQLARIDDRTAQSTARWALVSLNLRLGRHHGIGSGPNTVPHSLAGFLHALRDDDAVKAAVDQADPEVTLALANREPTSQSGRRRRRRLLRR